MAHAPELHSQVRALAWRLACGEMAWADYREQRRALVDEVARGDVALTYKKAVVRDDPTTPKDRDIEQVIIDMDEIESEGRRSRLPAYISVGILFALIIALLVVIWLNHRLELQQAERAAAPVVLELSAGEALLRDFQRDGVWTIESMENMLAEWRALDAGERRSARRSAAWRRVDTTLRARLNETQVLMQVDESGDAERLYEAMLAFRDTLSDN